MGAVAALLLYSFLEVIQCTVFSAAAIRVYRNLLSLWTCHIIYHIILLLYYVMSYHISYHIISHYIILYLPDYRKRGNRWLWRHWNSETSLRCNHGNWWQWRHWRYTFDKPTIQQGRLIVITVTKIRLIIIRIIITTTTTIYNNSGTQEKTTLSGKTCYVWAERETETNTQWLIERVTWGETIHHDT